MQWSATPAKARGLANPVKLSQCIIMFDILGIKSFKKVVVRVPSHSHIPEKFVHNLH